MQISTPSVKELKLALVNVCEKLVLKEHQQLQISDVQRKLHVGELRVNTLPL